MKVNKLIQRAIAWVLVAAMLLGVTPIAMPLAAQAGDDFEGTLTLSDGTPLQLTTEAFPLSSVANSGDMATVLYEGTTIDLSAVSGLFTIDENAGAATYSIESNGEPTGEATIDADGKTLTVTKAGTFIIGLATAETSTHEAGAMVIATLIVEKGDQNAPANLGNSNASAYGESDGIITGLTADTDYEYKKDSGDYIAVTSNGSGEITGLAAGAYVVRYAENELYRASEDSEVIVIGEFEIMQNVTNNLQTMATYAGESWKEAGDFLVLTSETYNYKPADQDKILEINQSGDYKVTMKQSGTTTGCSIDILGDGITVNLTLDGVKIDRSNDSGKTAIWVNGNNRLNLTLVGENDLKSSPNCSGIQAGTTRTIVITADSTGSLIATGGYFGAGIGGDRDRPAGGDITINGGMVIANGGTDGAGIGGGRKGAGGNVTINGGVVTANGGTNGAGIGGGYDGARGSLAINGGSVWRTGEASREAAPNNGAGKPAFLTTLTVGNPAVTNSPIAEGEIDDVPCDEAPDAQSGIYGINGVKTDAGGILYFWLPEGESIPVLVTANGNVYAGNISPNTNNNAMATLLSSPEQHNADITAAKGVIEGATYTGTQAKVGNITQAKAAVETIISGLSLAGVKAVVVDGSFTAAIAGTEVNANGTNGSYNFTVTLKKGAGTQQTTEGLTLIISAKMYNPTQDNLDISAVKTLIEGTSYTTTQAVAHDEASSLAKINEIIGALDLNGVAAMVNKVNYTAPVAGTLSALDGTNGSYTFTVTLNKDAGTQQTTVTLTLTISATAYVTSYFRVTGGIDYLTLIEAVAAVPDGGTITMQQDVVLDNGVNLNENKTYTIDLGGYTLSGDRVTLLRVQQGTVAIQNGSIVTTGDFAISVSGGTVSILSGNYTGGDDAIYCTAGTVTITSGHFVSTTDGANDGCLVERYNSGQILLASGSVASVDPWKNSGSPKVVTVTNPPLDNSDIAAAKALVEGASYTTTQAVAPDEAAALAKINEIIRGLSLKGVTPTINEVSYTAPIAGTAGNINGTGGSYTFTVTLNKGAGEQQTTIELTLTISAKSYDPTQDSLDISAAKDVIEGVSYKTTQANIGNIAQAKAAVEAIISDLPLNGVIPAVVDGTFTAATAGTTANISGTNGSYTFTVTLSKFAGTPQTTDNLTLIITATPYIILNFRVTGGIDYLTLEEAVAAVPNDGTITMLQDVMLDNRAFVELNEDKTYTIDLGGYTLSGHGYYTLKIWQGTVAIQNGSIVGTNTITNTDTDSIAIGVEGGTVSILSGNYIGDEDAIYCVRGTVTITSGHFVSTTDYYNDGCLFQGSNGQILLAPLSVADADPWKNDGNATDVTVYDTTQDNLDISAVKTIIEGASYTTTQANVGNIAQAKAAVEAIIGGLSLNSVTPLVANGTFTAATAGTAENTNGTNGSYTFTVTLNKGVGTPQTTATLTLTITATPYVAVYTIAFEANGGAVTPAAMQTEADGKLSELPTPTRSSSYRFDGWFTAASGGTQITTSTVFTADTSVYARWTYRGGSSGSGGNTTTTPPAANPTSPTDPAVPNVTTPDSQPPGTEESGTTTPPGNGTNETENGANTETPPGTTLEQEGNNTIPPGNPTEITMPGNIASVIIPDGSTKDDSGTITVGGGAAEINLSGDKQITLPVGSTISNDGKVTVGQGGAVVSFGETTLFIAEGTVLIFDDEIPLGYFVSIDNPFTDMKPDDWFYDNVIFAYTHGLFTGISATDFSPGASMTRGMFATVLARLDGVDLSEYTTSRFGDVETGQWYAASVEWAADNGIVSGIGEGKFDPNGDITREQVAVILYNFLIHKGYDLPSGSAGFADEDSISPWALEAVQTIKAMGIVGGRPGNLFDPQATATRAEVATIFANFIKYFAGGGMA